MLQMSMFTTVETSHTTDETSLRNEKPLKRQRPATASGGEVSAPDPVVSPVKPETPASPTAVTTASARPVKALQSAELFTSAELPVSSSTDAVITTGAPIVDESRCEPSEFEIGDLSGITVLRYRNNLAELKPVLIPLLAYHSYHNDARWVSWVGPSALDKSLLLDYGVNLSSIRMLVNEGDPAALLRIALAALSNGNSHLVVLMAEEIDPVFYQELASAAEEGESSLMVLLPAK